MKHIAIKSLELFNFKGISHIKFDDFPKETFFYGANGTGKTTIFDSFIWLLFGKDSLDRKDYEIKPLDSNNKNQKQIDSEVHATLIVDSEEVTLSRIYKEKWQKIKGSEGYSFKGNETECIFNQIPMKISDYNKKIAEIADEKLFKLITNPYSFEALPWKEKREVLVSIAGEISDEELFNSNEDFKKLESKLTNKSLPEYETQLKASIKKSKDEKQDIPSRIKEAEGLKPEALDFEQTQNQIDSKEKGIIDIDSQIENSSKSIQKIIDANTKVQQEIQKLNSQKSDIEIGLRNQAKKECFIDTSSVDALKSKLRLKESECDDYADNRIKLNSAIVDYQKQIEILQGKKQSLVDSYNIENAKQLVFNDNDFNCPCCSRPFEENDIDSKKQELISKFNINKTSLLNSIINDGNQVKKQLEVINNSLNAYQSKLDEQKGFIDQLRNEIVSIENEIQTAKAALASPKNEEEVYISLINNDAQISKLNIDIAKFQSSLKEVKAIDNSELKLQKQTIQSEINELRKTLSKQEEIEKINLRISELAQREKELSQIIADMEREQFVIDSFKKEKSDALEKSVNELFENVDFKLFDEQVNGGENPTCIALVNGVPFSTANTAGQINAGIDIINTLCKANQVTAPIFVDNRESVTNLIPTESQVVSLIVSPEHKKLTLKN